MDDFGGDLERWSAQNYMKINYNKTKEIILGKIRNQNIPTLTISGNPIQRVSTFKLLGVHISDNLMWESHIDSICSKANSRLYSLKRLKRAGLSINDLRCFYTTVIRPVLEYACVVWHHGLTKAQSDRLEALQKRAIRIIHGRAVFNMSYEKALARSQLESLSYRRAAQGKSFYIKITQPTSCLHHLLPSSRNIQVTSKLRHAAQYEHPLVHTKRYCSFINFALVHYQK